MNPTPAAIDLSDGTQVRGTQWSINDCWTLLFHEPGNDRDSDDLVPLVDAVVRSGSTAVAFDLPGHGFSDGVWTTESDLTETVATLADWVDRQQPAKMGIVAIGAACYPALQVAQDRKVDVLVLVSPPPMPELRARSSGYRGAGAAKLLVFGGADREYQAVATDLRTRSIGWAVGFSVGTAEQGTALISGAHRARIQEGVELFLREQWALGRRRGVPLKNQMEEIAR